MRAEVKFCGITRPEDAAIAAALGAWRLGVVFAWGPRVVDSSRAREIVAAGAGVPVIGVFGPQSTPEIINIAKAAGLAGAQLHRETTAVEVRQLHEAGLEVWRVMYLNEANMAAAILRENAEGADILLMDSERRGHGGTSGGPVSLEHAKLAREILAEHALALAGGLTPETVAAAIRFVRPAVVDVSSGVEISPGIKDPDRLRRFMEQVRDASAAD